MTGQDKHQHSKQATQAGGSEQRATQAGAEQRAIQQQQDARDRERGDPPPPTKPVQTGAVDYPAPPLPTQHLAKPGHEADMALKPRFMAELYRGSGKLEGMSAIVTGADSGIGRAVAVLFAREGADVAVFYLDEHDDAAETRRCVEAEGRRCLLIAGDVRDADFCREAVQQVVGQFGKLDVLVNNAAFQEHALSLDEITEERFDTTMHTNIYGYFHMAKAAVPHLRRGSAIVNTGSVTGLMGNKHLIDYATTKGAIHAFTKSLAASLLDDGIRVNAVAPGPVWTPLNPADQSPKQTSKFGADTDYRRPAQPEEISPAYVFLASSICSSYLTGVVLPITGSVGE